jgi:hypothetical protein
LYVLREYRPGRWARVDAESGAVLGLATEQEADRWIRDNLLDLDAGGNAGPGDQAADLGPLFDLVPEPAPAAPTSTARPTNGNGKRAAVATDTPAAPVVDARHGWYLENRARAALSRARADGKATIGVVPTPADGWGWRLVEGAPGVAVNGQRPADLVADLVGLGLLVVVKGGERQ